MSNCDTARETTKHLPSLLLSRIRSSRTKPRHSCIYVNLVQRKNKQAQVRYLIISSKLRRSFGCTMIPGLLGGFRACRTEIRREHAKRPAGIHGIHTCSARKTACESSTGNNGFGIRRLPGPSPSKRIAYLSSGCTGLIEGQDREIKVSQCLIKYVSSGYLMRRRL